MLLDIRLPGKDGLTLTRELRVRSEVGIILITGRNDDIDRIVGLECGADDYVIKPSTHASWSRAPRTSSAACATLVSPSLRRPACSRSSSLPIGRSIPIAVA